MSRVASRSRYGVDVVGGFGRTVRALAWLVVAALSGCDVHGIVGANDDEPGAGNGGGDGDGGALDGDGGSPTSGGDDGIGDGDGGGDGGSTTDDMFLFDVSPGDGTEVCLAPLPTVCDHDDDDPWHALGVACPGTPYVETELVGHPDAFHVQTGTLGTHGEYSPREGERMVILSTGRASEIPRTHAQLGCDPSICPSTALTPGSPMSTLPPPIDVEPVHPRQTCTADPALVGTGDCSNTLASEWSAGTGAYDYAHMAMRARVPETADALVYQFAFFSAEYPQWANQDAPFNDMYVAWLESEAWTGNVSFDELGHPISINGVFLDYLDAESDLCTETPCEAPQLDGFAMDGHAGTRWLETVAPVVPGEEIEMVFAIFDMSDAAFDTAVVLDGVHWGCTDLPPVTSPAG